jgi:hypothetical protein
MNRTRQTSIDYVATTESQRVVAFVLKGRLVIKGDKLNQIQEAGG